MWYANQLNSHALGQMGLGEAMLQGMESKAMLGFFSPYQ